MDRLSASQPLDREFENHTSNDHDCDTSTGCRSGLDGDLNKL